MNKIGLRKHKRLSPAEKQAEDQRAKHLAGLKEGTIIPVDKSKVFSRCAIPEIPDFYQDTWFVCRDCGNRELWTAAQQKRWYEEQGGEIEAVAVRCRACRRKKKTRQAVARGVHLDGIKRTRESRAEPAVQATAAPARR